MGSESIYHICRRDDWERGQASGRYLGSAQDIADGFIHLSRAEQLAATAAKHRAGQDGLLLVAVDPDRLGDALRWEPARGGQLFPHIYGPMPFDAVIAVTDLPLGADGRHIFPPNIPPLRD
jgi:uncharacterized protein (DUF952 family)